MKKFDLHDLSNVTLDGEDAGALMDVFKNRKDFSLPDAQRRMAEWEKEWDAKHFALEARNSELELELSQLKQDRQALSDQLVSALQERDRLQAELDSLLSNGSPMQNDEKPLVAGHSRKELRHMKKILKKPNPDLDSILEAEKAEAEKEV